MCLEKTHIVLVDAWCTWKLCYDILAWRLKSNDEFSHIFECCLLIDALVVFPEE